MNISISIIIPTYNRAHLLGETLEGILAQTYPHWECLVVDDGSTDDTPLLMESYTQNDARIQYLHRPKDRPKGANAARNYGFEQCKGEWVQWFDSDDLLLPTYLEIKQKAITKDPTLDFVVSRTLNMQEGEHFHIDKYEGNLKHPLNFKNYLTEKVYWMTPDFMTKRELLHKVDFDETLRSAQETNFFLKFLLQNPQAKGTFIDQEVTLRRMHPGSIQGAVQQDKQQASMQKLYSLMAAYKECVQVVTKEEEGMLLNKLIPLAYYIAKKNTFRKDRSFLMQRLRKTKGWKKLIAFQVSLFLRKWKKGYSLMNYARN